MHELLGFSDAAVIVLATITDRKRQEALVSLPGLFDVRNDLVTFRIK